MGRFGEALADGLTKALRVVGVQVDEPTSNPPVEEKTQGEAVNWGAVGGAKPVSEGLSITQKSQLYDRVQAEAAQDREARKRAEAEAIAKRKQEEDEKKIQIAATRRHS